MKHHPILFSTEMVEAILAGRKTMTRRIVTERNSYTDCWHFEELDLKDVYPNPPFGFKAREKTDDLLWRVYPKLEVGDILWVRETFTTETFDGMPYAYYAGNIEVQNNTAYRNLTKWKPSIHMPRKACRLFLEVKSVSAEYLKDISDMDAIKEGIDVQSDPLCKGIPFYKFYGGNDVREGTYNTNPKVSFYSLWVSINGIESWNSNPLVWVIEFERVEL